MASNPNEHRAIVVGFVDSAEGLAAVEHAITEAKVRGGRLVVVHSARGGTHTDADDVIAYREQFDQLEQRLRGEGVAYELHELIRGSEPAEDLVETANSMGAQLIVIGLRRRTPIGKLILGSHAQKILLTADCPVLTVKASA